MTANNKLSLVPFRLRRLAVLARRTARAFVADDCPTRAAALAYYVLFSIFPLVLGLVALVGGILGAADIEARLLELLQPYFPGSGLFLAETIRTLVAGSTSVGIFAVVSLLWSATALISALRGALNVVWAVPKARPFWRRKLLEFGLIGVAILFLLGSFLLTTILQVAAVVMPAGAEVLLAWLVSGPLFVLLTSLISVTLTLTAFTLAYRILPDTRVRWRHTASGAFVASLLFEVARVGFVVYLQSFAGYNVVYGPIAGVVVFLLWAYISSLVLLLGAEVAAQSDRLPQVSAG